MVLLGKVQKEINTQDEPTFTDLEPSAAGVSGDGYIWKYLFSVSPSDIIKFDSTEYAVVPNEWQTSADSQIVSVREAGDSTINFNQIKKVYIQNGCIQFRSIGWFKCFCKNWISIRSQIKISFINPITINCIIKINIDKF